MEELEEGVEGDERDPTERDHADREDEGTAPDRPPQTAAVGHPPAGDREHDRRGDRRDPQRHEDVAHVAHVGTLTGLQDRATGDGDVEVRRPEDEVGEDRIGGLAQLGRRVAAPGRRLGAALLEADPLRGQEREDRDRDDDHRRRDADHDRGDASAEALHRAILAGAERITRPRGSSPGPTSPPS